MDMAQLHARLAAAESILYMWACKDISTKALHKHMRRIGFSIDLRQGWNNVMHVVDLDTHETYRVEV